jgi:hypothetical protein
VTKDKKKKLQHTKELFNQKTLQYYIADCSKHYELKRSIKPKELFNILQLVIRQLPYDLHLLFLNIRRFGILNSQNVLYLGTEVVVSKHYHSNAGIYRNFVGPAKNKIKL